MSAITPYKWGWGEAGAAVAFWGFVEGIIAPVTSAAVISASGAVVYSTRKSREKREENEILLFIKEFLRIRGR